MPVVGNAADKSLEFGIDVFDKGDVILADQNALIAHQPRVPQTIGMAVENASLRRGERGCIGEARLVQRQYEIEVNPAIGEVLPDVAVPVVKAFTGHDIDLVKKFVQCSHLCSRLESRSPSLLDTKELITAR